MSASLSNITNQRSIPDSPETAGRILDPSIFSTIMARTRGKQISSSRELYNGRGSSPAIQVPTQTQRTTRSTLRTVVEQPLISSAVASQDEPEQARTPEPASDIDTQQVEELLQLDENSEDHGPIESAIGNARVPQGPGKSGPRKTVERSKAAADGKGKGPAQKSVAWADLLDIPDSESEDDEEQDPSLSYVEPLESESDIDFSPVRQPVLSQTKASAQKKTPAVTQKKRGRPASNPVRVVEIEMDILLSVQTVLNVFRFLKVHSSDSFKTVEKGVRSLVGDADQSLGLTYITAWGNKTSRLGLEGQDDWEILVATIAGNQSRKNPNQWHAQLYHTLDTQSGGKGAGKGKGTKASGKKEEAGSDEETIDWYALILDKWKCTSHAGYQCYHEEEDGTETLHIGLSNQVMSEWADKCKLKVATPAELPRALLKRLTKDTAGAATCKSDTNTRVAKVLPKVRGTTGPNPMVNPTDLGYNQIAETPSGYPPWQGFYGSAMPPVLIMPQTLPSPVKRQLGISSLAHPSSSSSSSNGPRLRVWLTRLDEENSSDSSDSEGEIDYSRERYLSLEEPLKRHGIRRVRDILRHPKEDLSKLAGCTIGMAARVRELAEEEMKK